MDCSKRFIVTQNESIANKLIAHGFNLLSNVCGTYTFINQAPEKFDFSSIDIKKLHFTNKISI